MVHDGCYGGAVRPCGTDQRVVDINVDDHSADRGRHRNLHGGDTLSNGVKNFAVVTGPAREKFVPAQGIGPFRTLKRAAGQYHTQQAGELNLKTGEFSKPTLKQGASKVLSDVMGRGTDPAMYPAAVLALEAGREGYFGGPTPVMDGAAHVYNGVAGGYSYSEKLVDDLTRTVSNWVKPIPPGGSGAKTQPQRP